MKPALFLLSLFVLLSACNADKSSSEQFKEIDFFFFNNSPEAFSLKLIGHDSVFVRQYVSSNSNGSLNNKVTYFSLLKGNLKQQFDSLVATIDLGKLDSLYETDQIDGDEYKLYFEGATVAKQISVHSKNAPKELELLKILFIKVKSSLAFIPVDTIITFRENPPESKLTKQIGSR